MAISKVDNFAIRGICCALPKKEISIHELGKSYFPREEIQKIEDIIGIKKLYLAQEGQTSSDLCCEAAERLLSDLNWEKNSIDGVLFISQTPDYIAPATSFLLQYKLGLGKHCIALDINLGCSGYVYGIWLASQFISTGTCKRVLVLVGDTLSKLVSKKDKSVALIFGDGASASAVEYSEEKNPATFILNSDGSGANSLIVPAGGFRRSICDETKKMEKDEDGNIRNDENIHMNGMDIFGFAVREVPKVLNEIIQCHGWTLNDVDKVYLHQANSYMLKFIAKKIKISTEKIPQNIDRFGNTSGTTIPLLICDKMSNEIRFNSFNTLMAGFGVGLSWGAVALNMGNIHCSEILYI